MDVIYQNAKKKKKAMPLLLKRVRHLLDIYKPFFYFSVSNLTDSLLKKIFFKSKNIYQWRKHSHSMEANK